MPLMPGTRLGPYEIIATLGSGGMGEVYKARDTRLNRIIAIKVSSEQFSERFEGEAHAVAALNHSHICTLHDVGPNYLEMEYIEGPDLPATAFKQHAELLQRRDLEVPEAEIRQHVLTQSHAANAAAILFCHGGASSVSHNLEDQGCPVFDSALRG